MSETKEMFFFVVEKPSLEAKNRVCWREILRGVIEAPTSDEATSIIVGTLPELPEGIRSKLGVGTPRYTGNKKGYYISVTGMQKRDKYWEITKKSEDTRYH